MDKESTEIRDQKLEIRDQEAERIGRDENNEDILDHDFDNKMFHAEKQTLAGLHEVQGGIPLVGDSLKKLQKEIIYPKVFDVASLSEPQIGEFARQGKEASANRVANMVSESGMPGRMKRLAGVSV